MVNYWKAKSNGTISPENVKMFLYGVHETTVADFVSAIGVRRRHVPEFSEAVILELYEDVTTKKYSIKVYDQDFIMLCCRNFFDLSSGF